MNLRVALPKDSAQIAEISRLSFQKAFRNAANASEVDAYLDELDSNYFEGMLSEGAQIFLIEQAGHAIAFAQFSEQAPPNSTQGQYLMLERLYTLPKHQDSGAGTMLLNHGKGMLAEQGKDTLWLQVLRSNTRAIAFYLNQGFSEFGQSPGKFEADGEMDLWLRWSRT